MTSGDFLQKGPLKDSLNIHLTLPTHLLQCRTTTSRLEMNQTPVDKKKGHKAKLTNYAVK